MTDPGPDSALRQFRIPGGIDLLVYPTAKFKTSLVNILLHRPLDDLTAAGALVPYLLRRGTRRLPDLAAISRHLELLFGAGLDVDVLRFGERQILAFRLDVVDDRYLLMGGRDLLRQGLSLLRDILTDPVLEDGGFRREVFEQERLNLRRFVERMIDDKGRYAFERCVGHMCPGENYARCEYGDAGSIDDLTRDGVTDVWQEVLHTAPMEIYVVGNVDPEAVRDSAEELFGSLEGRDSRDPPPPASVGRAGRVTRVEEHAELVQARLVMGYRTEIRYGHPLSVPLAVWDTLFGGGSFSRLFRHVRERRSLAYYCSSSVDLAKGVAFVQAGIDGASADRVESLVRRQLTEMRKGRIELDEMRAAKRHIQVGLESLTDSASRIAGFLGERRAAGSRGSVAKAMAEVKKVRRSDLALAAQTLKLDTVYLLANGHG